MKKYNANTMHNSKAKTDTVFVFYNSPSGIKFKLEKKDIEILGAPLSEIYSPSGQRHTQGKFGITEILREDWEEIEKLYGEMKIFKAMLIYAASSKNYGADKAKEQEKQLNGNEQILITQAHTIPEN